MSTDNNKAIFPLYFNSLPLSSVVNTRLRDEIRREIREELLEEMRIQKEQLKIELYEMLHKDLCTEVKKIHEEEWIVK